MIKDTSAQDTVVTPTMGRKVRLPMVLGLAGLLTSALVWASLGHDSSIRSVESKDLRMATITRGTLVRDIATTGKIVAANAPVLYSTEQGVVTLLSQPGDEVEQGQVVAQIDSPKLRSRFQQEQSVFAAMESDLERAKLDARREQLRVSQVLDMAKVDLEAADRESRRGDQLIENSLISRIDFEKGKDELHKANLLHQHALQEVDLMRDTLTFELKNRALEVDRQALVVTELARQIAALDIKAPVKGIIGNWLVEQKARIGASQPMLTVVDLSAFEAELAVPESYADDLGIGMDVELSFGSVTVMGHLSSISPEVRNREVTARVRFEAIDSLSLRQNQRLSARVLLENRPNVLMVKRGDFLNRGGATAFVMNDDMVQRTAVTLGARSMSEIEVIDGAKEGDVWVISGTETFKNDTQIQIR
ncbi:efflux transporter periplasmic adaptor subunit [Shewanella sp. UCD-FRSSP16_17]|uniref:efflux RND transporter periplasmic adaptor subunit n=1 Tax=unclassified Shewanella TaxID=196818 RepID=UPI0007EE9B5B|nr:MULTISPECIES: HlyD family efflux transporter periplasmic adaptor subunit [unclassified Shewanella]MBQ4889820.1 HlyD family efflux transporter periplasmic adaptor subunit [Shewanella sp. MMG014]OBT10594.1 efflux transporter periplasmic adaptor subunit [Shewanella sp. UCD-FRSSP16_17]